MLETQESNKLTLLQHKDGDILLEYNEDWTAIHLQQHDKLTPSLYKWIKYQMPQLNRFLQTISMPPLMCAVQETNEGMNKLVDKVGFVRAGNTDGLNVYIYKDM